MKTRKVLLMTASLLIVGMLFGCKPTEKNYREAYEAAQGKNRQEETALGLPAILQHDDGISLRRIGNDSVWVSHEVIRAMPDDQHPNIDKILKGKYGLGISKYRMSTNARAQVEDLRAKGYDAILAGNKDDRWYVVIATYADIKEGAEGAKNFKPGEFPLTLVGLKQPVLIYFR